MAFPRMSTTQCAICGYDRTAIPESPRCPECGFPFHEPLRILRTRVVPFWIAAGSFILIVAVGFPRRSPSGAGLSILTVFIVFLQGLFLHRWGAIGIGRTGVAIRGLLRGPRWIPFSEIDVQQKARGVYFLYEKIGGPLRLPTAGMRWKQRLGIHAEIGEAWAQERSVASDPVGALEPPPLA